MRRLVPLLALFSVACATTYQPKVTGPSALSFALTPEQCEKLKGERRTFHATGQTSLYFSGAGSLISVIALAFTKSDAATAVSAGAALVAGGVSAFSDSQVSDLDQELATGNCPR